MLSSLSADLFPEILQHLSKKDILACLLVNSFFNTQATPAVWSTITFGRSYLAPYGSLSATSHSFLDERNRNNWKYVRNLKIYKTSFSDSSLTQLSSFLEISDNISSLQIIGASSQIFVDDWSEVMYRNWVPLLYSSKLLSRVVHLSFTGLRTIPLQSILAQCPQLRDLRLVNSRWVQEDAKEEDWSGVPLESLSFSPASRDNPLNFGAALGVLLHSGGNKSFLHNLRYDLCLSGLDDAGCLFQLVTLLNAAPPVCSSLRHLSLGSNIWTYILLDERYEPDTLHLLPFSHLPHLESLSITTPTNSALQPVDNFFATGLIISSDSQSNDDDLNCFCGWFCRHLTLESSLPPSFTEVIFVIEVDVDLVSQNIEAAPLSPDLESVLISSQFHFNFIVKTRNVFRDSMNREYWKCSRTLKMWGKGIFNAGKMTVLQR